MAIVKILSASLNAGWKVGDHVELEDRKARELAEKKEVLIVSIEEPKVEHITEAKPLEVKPKKGKKIKK